jgi:hypothetical protein
MNVLPDNYPVVKYLMTLSVPNNGYVRIQVYPTNCYLSALKEFLGISAELSGNEVNFWHNLIIHQLLRYLSSGK